MAREPHTYGMEMKMNQFTINYKRVTLAILLALAAMVPFVPMVAQACGSGGATGGC